MLPNPLFYPAYRPYTIQHIAWGSLSDLPISTGLD